MKSYREVVVATVVGLLAVTTPAQAQTVSWSLGTFGATGGAVPNDACVYNNTGNGNVGTCDATGSSTEKLNFRGYSFTGSTTTSTVSAGALNTWGSSGIGMCNTNEASSCTSPNHAVDNVGTFTDFIYFQTGTSMALKSVSFGWTNGDADFTVLRYTGGGDPLTALNNSATTMAGLLSGGWSVLGSVDGTNAGTFSSFNPTDLSSRYWIVATYNTALNTKSGLDASDDAFKINGISGTMGSPGTSTVTPEPSTYALMTAGLIGIFAAARRRRQA